MTTSVAITEYRNAVSLSDDNSWMDVEINHPSYGWIPYTVNPSDADMTIDNAALLALIGSDFAAYIAPTQTEIDAAKAVSVRGNRDNILSTVVDPMVTNPLRWADLTAEKQTEWTEYRQLLLDVPQQEGFPHSISWPTQPE